VVDWYTQLLKYGIDIPSSEQFVINCPLPGHKDKRASCSINIEKGVWICYAGCGQGSLLSLISGVSQQPIEHLKGLLDIPIVHSSFFDEELQSKEEDIVYPQSYEGLSPLCDDHWIYSRGFAKDILSKWDCKQNTNGDFVLPVYSAPNNILGWITRRREATPKYLFSKHFKKSHILFGINQITDTDTIVVVEGALDAIWLNQHNYSSVAVLGASVSKYQIDLLAELNPREIILALDNDNAGQEGIERALKTTGTKLKVALDKQFMVSFVELPNQYKDFQDIRNNEEIDLVIKNKSIFNFNRRTKMSIITFDERKPLSPPKDQNRFVEYFFQPGDSVFFNMLASGDDSPEKQQLEKRWVDSYFLYTWPTGPNQFESVLDHEDVDNSHVPDDVRSRMKISFWVYIHEVYHSLQHRLVVSDDYQNLVESGVWEETETLGGKKMFKEEINGLRIITTNRTNWEQQISPIYDDEGALNTVVMKMKREGKGIDTRYFISPTLDERRIPDDVLTQAETVDSIQEYFYGKYVGESLKNETNLF